MKPNIAKPSDRAFAARVALAAIRGYQLLFSQYFTGACRFVPSCSEYAREAIDAHGCLRGGWLALRRISRCHPLGSSGHDPVPSLLTKRMNAPIHAERREPRRHRSRGCRLRPASASLAVAKAEAGGPATNQ